MLLQIDGLSVSYARGPRHESQRRRLRHGHRHDQDGNPVHWLRRMGLAVTPPAHRSAAVSKLSLSLAPGAIGVLVGPSGCGKTTLLRAVAGLEPAHEGRICMDGLALSDATTGTHLAPEARCVGMVFQDYALFPHMSVQQNVAFGLQHLPEAKRHERVRHLLELVGLNQAAQRLPHQLSGGQQQRVALARALAPAPKLLLLDEPLSALDPELRERLAQDIRRILQADGTSALIVTHDQAEAFALADVVGVMNQGRLEQWADSYTVYHRPATRFVATFIGQGVFAPAHLETQAGQQVVHTPFGTVHDADVASLREPGPCDILLRADDVFHDDESPVRAQVLHKAFRGAEFLYTLRLQSGEQLLALVPSHHDHALGEWIGVRPDVSHVVLFDRSLP